MRTLVIILIAIAILVGVGVAGYQPAIYYWELRSMPKWRQAEVTEGEIVRVVNATGTIKPVLQISVGAFVSGPIKELFVEFNDEVKKDQLLATIDPRIYAANVSQSKATLDSRIADRNRIIALRKQAINDAQRAEDLKVINSRFISTAEIDRVNANKGSLEAQLELAEASIEQARAQLKLAETNLEYTEIRSPVAGKIINRKIDPGQTLAAQFQTPELFIIAPDMRQTMHVHASVDEADVGLIKVAKQRNLPVTFTVDAYPDTLFKEGRIEEIRLSSATTQNVVTYPVVVATPNLNEELLPGMTASLSFEVDRRDKAIKIPNSALRFFPQPQHVRKQDQALLEGKIEEQRPANANDVKEIGLSAAERSEARSKRNLRHVWVVDGHKLKAVEVVVGLADSRFTELVSGNVKLGDKLVTGIEPPKNWGS